MRIRRLLLAAAAAALPATAQAGAMCRAVIEPAPATVNSCTGGSTVTIAAVGDVLLHRPLQRHGYASRNGFRNIWRTAEPFISRADIAYANLEGPAAQGVSRTLQDIRDPGAKLDEVVYTGYPQFNYNPRIVKQLKAAGFDVVSTANNHAMDRGPLGADRTIAALKSARLSHTGTIAAGAGRSFVTHVDSPAGPVAFIACSFDTNGLADPSRQVLRCYRDRAELLSIIRQQARNPQVAGVIVTPHWGSEYATTPDAAQRSLARDMAAAGATAILGAHPHVVQRWDWLSGPVGKTLAIYSLGNFVSGQLDALNRRSGALAWLELCRGATGKLAVAQAGWIPVVMYKTAQGPYLSTAGTQSKWPLDAQARDLFASVLPTNGTQLDLICKSR
ncbi:CapA family protein [Pseudoruegeria sp. HB172150]|uniref:CapA family protein n=1 Tax=Pseudoruegeria sp. HB172150 TaxID=2721164 RepID=UPI0015549CBF|nr:CapA family protein [Pseudoruegeria sp. HB172150]